MDVHPNPARSAREASMAMVVIAAPSRALTVVTLHPTDPLAVAVPAVGACAACGINLAHRSVAIFDPLDGIVCTDCLDVRDRNLERCIDCGALVELGSGGIRLIAGGRVLHDCPRAEYDVYALASMIYDERQWKALHREPERPVGRRVNVPARPVAVRLSTPARPVALAAPTGARR